MAHLNSHPTPPKLLAITINGAITVESDEDRQKREERRKQRKSRWDSTQSRYGKSSKVEDSTPILALPPPGGIKDNPAALAARLTLPTNIDASKMSGTQQEIYVLQMQIHDATRNLAKPDLGIQNSHF